MWLVQRPPRVDASIRRNAFLIAVALGAAAASGAVLALVHSPTLSLEYIQQLRWPLAVVSLAWLFRRPISAFLDRIEALHVPTPLGPGKIDSPSSALRPGDAPALPVDSGVDEEDDDAQAPERPADESDEAQLNDPLALAEDLTRWQEYADTLTGLLSEQGERLDLLAQLNVVFQAQINFLNVLEAAPDGLTLEAVGQYYSAMQTVTPAWAAFELPTLTGYLFSQRFIEIAPSGNYVITDRGRKLTAIAREQRYAQKSF